MSDLTLQPRAITPHAILAEKLGTLVAQLEDGNASTDVLELAKECHNLAAPLDAYLAQCSSQPSNVLNEVERLTNEQDWDSAFAKAQTDLPLEREMLTGGLEGQFLKMLVSLTRAKDVLEIGSFTSYASIAMAEALPVEGSLIACEYDPFTADFAQQQVDKSEHGKKIKIVVGDAAQTIKRLAQQGKSFDLIFIDADKTGYKNYYNMILEHGLLNPNGVIAVDNTLLSGQPYGGASPSVNGKAVDAFNQFVAADDRVHQVMIPLRDGITLIQLAQH